MKRFTVTYRTEDGKLTHEQFAAESKSELFKILSAKRISAIRIAEARSEAKVRHHNTGLSRFVVCAVAVVALFLVLLWFVSGNATNNQTVAPKHTKGRIAEVTPVKAQVPKPEPEPEPYKETPEELRRNGMWTDEDGNLRRRDGSYFFGKPNKEKPLNVDLSSRHPEQTAFKRSSEISIAHVLMIEPGEPIENWVKFGKRFNDDFKASLNEEIKILPEDDDYVKELKQAVISTKAELKRRMEQGEDVAEIINETRAELERLGQYREEIKKHVLEIARDPHMTDGDLEDLSKAADEMLRDKGVPTLSNSKIFMLQLKLAASKAREQQ